MIIYQSEAIEKKTQATRCSDSDVLNVKRGE